MSSQQQMSIEEAMVKALEIAAEVKENRNKVYVWKQRLREGKLSHALMKEILDQAGFVRVVEEKWAFVENNGGDSSSPTPSIKIAEK